MSQGVEERRNDMNVRREFFSDNVLAAELFDLICGEKIGDGISRIVHEHKQDPSLVIKFEVSTATFQNVAEWETWNELYEIKALARWLAPCVGISPCGTILLQRRVRPVTLAELPKKVPVFLTDCKLTNWGILDGRAVCCDYGRNRLMATGATARMKRADFFDDD